MRRLKPLRDWRLFRRAYLWDKDTPRWYREMDKTFATNSFARYLWHARRVTQANVGVFDGKRMVALITTNLIGRNAYDCHIAAERNASRPIIAEAVANLRAQMFRDLEAHTVAGWIARQNRPLMRFALSLGFRPDGLRMLKGSVRGKVIEWVRVAYTRADYAGGELI